jgi:PBP1b-binding outer membrane lipoprotein LpoB
MKKTKAIIMLIVLLYVLVGCSNTNTTPSSISTTINNASPQSVLKTNPDADIFIMNNTVYINATSIDWVTKLTLKEGKVLGKINETGVKKGFQNWNATKLNTNTIVYEVEGRSDIVLAKVDGKYVPYLKFVEG